MLEKDHDLRGTLAKIFGAIVLFIVFGLSLNTFTVQTAYASVLDTDMVGNVQIGALTDDSKKLSPDIMAPSAIVMTDTGEIIYSRNATEERKIASTTKIMTAIVASDFDLETPIMITKRSADTPGSEAGLVEGDFITLHELIEGIMLPSGNDAAYAIAIGVGAKMLDMEGQLKPSEDVCIQRFVKAMNDKATALGMTSTLFSNPCGLDDEGYEGPHHSTARDVARMTAAAHDIPVVAEISKQATCDMTSKRGAELVNTPLKNTHRLIGVQGDITGMKTGFTDAAGACLSTTYTTTDGKTWYCVVLGNEVSDDTYVDTQKLIDWSNKAKRTYQAFGGCSKTNDNKNIIGELGLPAYIDKTVSVAADKNIVFDRWYWEAIPEIETKVDVPDSGLEAGQKVGEARVVVKNGEQVIDTIGTTDIVATESVAEPSVFDRIGIFFNRFLLSMNEKPTTASDNLECGKIVIVDDHSGGAIQKPGDVAKSPMNSIPASTQSTVSSSRTSEKAENVTMIEGSNSTIEVIEVEDREQSSMDDKQLRELQGKLNDEENNNVSNNQR